MMTVKAPTKFIDFDEDGQPILAGTTTKVIEIALDQLANGYSAAEIHFQHYGGHSMAQIHAALSYYYEHQAEFDAEIARQLEEVETLRREAGESPFVRRMRAEGRLP